MSIRIDAEDLDSAVAAAVADYWQTRTRQQTQQASSGRTDQGERSAATGGAQMSGFVQLIARIIAQGGIDPGCIFCKTALELPGYFRPTKKWDLLVVSRGRLIAALEAKSHVGPSFSNNFNNRTEEALGSALDLWTAFREGIFSHSAAPFLGYLLMLEDCPTTNSPVRAREPHFKVLPEFANASYAERYELFCRKLVRERHYSAAAFITSRSDMGLSGVYAEPADDLTISGLVRALAAHAAAYAS